jgi:UDP-glucose 4-epimerase
MLYKNNFLKKHILITGINGFIGQHIANKLLSERYNILGISLEDNCVINNKNLIYEKIDITDYKRVNQIFKSYDIESVIHLAAIVQSPKVQSKEIYYNVNYRASENIFRQCAENNVKKLLFASTVGVYKEQKGKIIHEDFECSPYSIYGRSKLLAEQSLISIAGGKLKYAIMRFASVYASNFKLYINKRIYIIPQKLAYYFKKGDYSFNLCSINNITDFISKILKKPDFESGIYNLSDSKNYSVKEIISLEKQHRNLRWTIKMPYFICLALIFLYEKTYCKLLKKESAISVYNFKKLFRGTVYSNIKAGKIVKHFKWDIVNTLYK